MKKRNLIFKSMVGGLAGLFGAVLLAGQAPRPAWELGLMIFILVASVAGEKESSKKE